MTLGSAHQPRSPQALHLDSSSHTHTASQNGVARHSSARHGKHGATRRHRRNHISKWPDLWAELINFDEPCGNEPPSSFSLSYAVMRAAPRHGVVGHGQVRPGRVQQQSAACPSVTSQRPANGRPNQQASQMSRRVSSHARSDRSNPPTGPHLFAFIQSPISSRRTSLIPYFAHPNALYYHCRGVPPACTLGTFFTLLLPHPLFSTAPPLNRTSIGLYPLVVKYPL